MSPAFRPARVRAAVLAVLTVAFVAFVAPDAGAALDRAGAVARARANAPEAVADRLARAESAGLVDAAGASVVSPRISFEAEGSGFGPVGGDESALRLGVSRALDVRGLGSARRAVATAESDARAASADGRDVEIAARTAEAYGALLVAGRRLALADSVADAARTIAARAAEAVKRETISPYALRQLERDATRAADAALRAREARARADAALRALLLAAPGETLEPVDDLDGPAWACVPETLVARAAAAHPDVRAARAEEARLAAEATRSDREGRATPELHLFVAHEKDRVEPDAFGDWADSDPAFDGYRTSETILGAGVSVPLGGKPTAWDAGRARLEAAQATARARRVDGALAPAIAAACAAVTAAQERAALHARGAAELPADGARLDLAYREGRLDLDSYLAQRERLAEALAARLDALADVETARAELARASGLDPITLAALVGGAPEGADR